MRVHDGAQSLCAYLRLVVILNRCYWPAGDTVLGVASVLLVLGALMPGVEVLLFGRPEFGDPAPMPLSELGVPGVP